MQNNPCALTRFPIENMYPSSTHLVIGRPNRGKSTLTCSILAHVGYAGKVVVFSPTEINNGTFSTHIPGCYIYPEYSEVVLKKVVAGQVRHCAGVKPKDTHEERVRDFSKYGLVIVLDDVAFDYRKVETSTFQQILCNHRNMQIMLVYIVQDPVMLSRHNRTQVDYVWALNDNYPSVRKRLFDWYFGVYGTREFQRFEADFLAATDNFGAMVSDNISHPDSRAPTKFIHWYRAPRDAKTRAFRIGSKRYWAKAAQKGFPKLPCQGGPYVMPSPRHTHPRARRRPPPPPRHTGRCGRDRLPGSARALSRMERLRSRMAVR